MAETNHGNPQIWKSVSELTFNDDTPDYETYILPSGSRRAKTMENLRPNSRCPGRGLNPRPPEYESIVLSNRPWRSITNKCLPMEILIRVIQRQTVVCEQYPWHQTAIKDVDNWMVKGYCHDFKWKTCPEVRLWHSSLQLLNLFSLGRMKHAAESVVSELWSSRLKSWEDAHQQAFLTFQQNSFKHKIQEYVPRYTNVLILLRTRKNCLDGGSSQS